MVGTILSGMMFNEGNHIPKLRISIWFRNLAKTALIFLIKTVIKSLEILPSLGILRPLLFSALTPTQKKKSQTKGLPLCPYEVNEFDSLPLSNIRIIEVTEFRKTQATRGINNYLTRLFSKISNADLEEVIFISFGKHEDSVINSEFLRGRNIYNFDAHCTNCHRLIKKLSRVSHKITFTNYFHENISTKFCSTLLGSIPQSNVIIYDLIPKSSLINFSSVPKMIQYFSKFRLLAGSNLYPISRSTKREVEAQGLQVRDVLRFDLVDEEKSNDGKENTILLFGSMSPRKNILRTVMAWDRVQHEFPEFRLMLVGHYSNFAKLLISYILKLEDNSICFAGEISDFELDKLYRNSKLLIAPSTCEGLGLPLIRAIEFGLPFICADNDSYLEFVVNKISFFNPFSVFEMSQSIRSAITALDEYVNRSESVNIGTLDFSEIV
jgi:glycosyltransferase involved in cell wall biosynthesis